MKKDKYKTYGMSSYDSNAFKSKNPNSGIYETDSTRTLDVNGQNPACNQGGTLVCQKGEEMEQEPEYDVRRLMPNECARLQGFPPDWCSDVPHSDSAEYKLWGNGIALPSILPMIQNAVRFLEEFKNGK